MEIAQHLIAGDATRQELDDVIAELRATAVRQFGPRPAARRRVAHRGLEVSWETWSDPDDGRARMCMDPAVADAVR